MAGRPPKFHELTAQLNAVIYVSQKQQIGEISETLTRKAGRHISKGDLMRVAVEGAVGHACGDYLGAYTLNWLCLSSMAVKQRRRKMDDKNITILLMYDGWEAQVGNKKYSWDHNDTDLGTKALSVLLSDLGFNVDVEEVY